MPHLKIGTKVRIKNYSVEFNGLEGFVGDRNGEEYEIAIPGLMAIYGIYLCELEEIK